MSLRIIVASGAVLGVFLTTQLGAQRAPAVHQNAVLDLWMAGKTAFGVYAPNENAPQRGQGTPRGDQAGRGQAAAGDPQREGAARGEAAARGEGGQRGQGRRALYTREGAEKLAMNPLYDFVFLNLEGSYDTDAVRAYAEGLRSPKAVSRKTLIVRIPSIERDGADAAKTRIKEVLDAGGDGVTLPHVRNVEEAKQAVGFFQQAGANVWSPSNPRGEKIAMLMIEDPAALEQVTAFADVRGYSILACGIGSLTQALGGDRAGAEAGTQKVLAETKRVKLANMLTANTQDVEKRVKEGFLALLMQGASADEAITLGRTAAGR
jgi:2-keto-3-deoxy-L-rhamnonate aldolase RhmA